MLARAIYSTSLLILFALIRTVSASAEPVCAVTPEKKALIISFLCGQEARDTEYRKSGSGCFKRSIEKRLEDSAIQVFAFRLCGDETSASELESSIIINMRLMEKLAPCTGEKVNISSIWQQRVSYVKGRAGAMSCTQHLRSSINRRKPALKAYIEEGSDQNIERTVFERLGIALDGYGNVSER